MRAASLISPDKESGPDEPLQTVYYRNGIVQTVVVQTLRIKMNPSAAPGKGPFTKMRFRSSSMRTTDTPRKVTVSCPIWPGIFFPFHTLPGVVP